LLTKFQREVPFEYTKQRPALIFRGGRSDVSFTYFDMRQYFKKEKFNENMGISKSRIFDIFDIAKIRRSYSEFADYKSQQKIVVDSILNELICELSECGLYISSHLLEHQLKYEQRWFFPTLEGTCKR